MWDHIVTEISSTEELIRFLEEYLSQPGFPFVYQGLQQGYKSAPSLILFAGPSAPLCGRWATSTLAIETSLLRWPRDEVLAELRRKITKSQQDFARFWG